MVRVETVIVGAGPAGLSVAACLQRVGVPFVVLERGDRVGASWDGHYERLHLHTDKSRSELPYFPFPKRYPKYPSRAQLIAYLESYAWHFGLRPRFCQDVVSARPWDGRWYTRTQDTVYVSRHLVVATGYNGRPHMPTWPGQETFVGEIVHSSAYSNGVPYRGKRVLVVGFGNSAGEITIDLWEHGAKPTLAVRGPVNVIPRDLLGIPILAMAIPLRKLPRRLADALTAPIVRLVFGDLGRLGLRKAPDGPFTQIQQREQIPLIDVGTIDLIRNGHIEVRPGVEQLTGRDVVFADGTRQPFDALILATGYRPAVNTFLEQASLAIDEHGNPRQSGHESLVAGLYFCGFYVSPTGMLREIAAEAKHIARDIAQKHASALST